MVVLQWMGFAKNRALYGRDRKKSMKISEEPRVGAGCGAALRVIPDLAGSVVFD
jgi:hypothetical protein